MYLTQQQTAETRLMITFWMANGYSFNQACAWVAMAIAESSLNPKAEGDRDAAGRFHAFGLYEENDERSAAIKKETGVDMTKLPPIADQLKGVAWEVGVFGPYKQVASALRATSSPEQGAKVLVLDFEKPKDKVGGIKKRGAYAEAVAAQFSDMKPRKERPTA